MTVVRSETRVLVSHPPLPNPPPRGPTTSPPKMEVRRRMKVDFPQPESAATPIIIGSGDWVKSNQKQMKVMVRGEEHRIYMCGLSKYDLKHAQQLTLAIL